VRSGPETFRVRRARGFATFACVDFLRLLETAGFMDFRFFAGLVFAAFRARIVFAARVVRAAHRFFPPERLASRSWLWWLRASGPSVGPGAY
jgi:hypothetical protein